MPRNPLYRTVAFVTETFPRHGARCVDRLIFGLAGNQLLLGILSSLNLLRLKRAGRINRVCVLCDMNIGDAVTSQAVVSAIRAYMPCVHIDYVVRRSADRLIEGNPEIDRVHGIYEGSPFPNRSDLEAIRAVLTSNRFDLVFMLCPFLSGRELNFPKSTAVIGLSGLIAEIVRAQTDPEEISHVVHRMYCFVDELFSRTGAAAAPRKFEGARVTLSAAAVGEASRFLARAGCANAPKILFNPDTSSDFTRIPFDMQVRILSGLCELPCRILLGEGHVSRGIEKSLCAAMPEGKREKITIVPASLPIDSYAALIDCCDVFITGDTGPLHIAAARKYARNGGHQFRNRTSVLSVYAAQPARLYGYDSSRPGFFAGSQDAAAHVYETASNCRNMATVNKAFIACREASHFFRDLDCDAIIRDAAQILRDAPFVTLPDSSGSAPLATSMRSKSAAQE